MTTSKKLISLFALLLALALMPLAGCADQGSQASSSAQSSSQQAASDSSSAEEHVSITLEVDASMAKEAGADVSAIEGIAGPVEHELAEGSTAYDALVASGAEIEGTSSYVTSIDGISEDVAGKSSGWMYEVNGETPMVSADECILKENDAVRWYYSSWE